MVVRICWSKRAPSSTPEFQSAALAVASLLVPAALVAFTVTFWSLAAELHLTARFFIISGLLSHWQIWLVAAAALSFGAWLLRRYAAAIDSNVLVE